MWSLFKSWPFVAYLLCFSYPSIFAIGIIAIPISLFKYLIESSLSKLWINRSIPSVLAGSLPCNPPIKQTFNLDLDCSPKNTIGMSLPFWDFPMNFIWISLGYWTFKSSKKLIISWYLVNPFFLSNAGVEIFSSKSRKKICEIFLESWHKQTWE